MEIDALIATRLKKMRSDRSWTLDHLADASQVSRAMLSKIERGEVSATAALLSRIAAAFDVPLSELLASGQVPGAVARKASRARWQDPATGFVRETVSPPATGSAVEIVEIQLPPKARVGYSMPAPVHYTQHVIALAGTVRVRQQDTVDLAPGDALYMVPAGEFSFENPGSGACRYLVVMERARRPA